MLPQVQAGAVRALAVSSDQRNPALPEVPTVQQAGVTGYNVASWNALAAPAGTPPAVLAVLNRAVRDAVASPLPCRTSWQGWACACRRRHPGRAAGAAGGEIKRWGDVIRAAKIEPE
jgi:tripartite-type tricarboxylate transporter receptor subunit TctC